MGDYRLVLVDADDTLFDFKRAERHAFSKALGRFGLADDEFLFETYSAINRDLWARLERGEIDQGFLRVERFRRFLAAAGAGLRSQGARAAESSPGAARDLGPAHALDPGPGAVRDLEPEALSEAFVAGLASGTFLVDGALELCEHLKSKYLVAIVTNGIKDVQLPRVRDSAIARFVDLVVVSEEVGVAKPSPGIFARACGLAGVLDKSRVVMIGDALGSDIKGGNDFGIDTIWYNPGGVANGSGVSPTFEVRRLEEIRDIL